MRRVNATSLKNSDPVRTTRPLNILQWNAEGIYNKKVLLTEPLHMEDVDVACSQKGNMARLHFHSLQAVQ